jgi:alkaline phosphatase D
MRRSNIAWLRPVVTAAAAGASLAWVRHLYRRERMRRGRLEFVRSPLEEAVAPGASSAHGVRLWGRSSTAGAHELTLVEAASGRLVARATFEVSADPALDGTWAVGYPEDFAGCPRLEAATAYRFAVRRAGAPRPLGEGGFETSPEDAAGTPQRFSFAVMSCHLPFDHYGRLSERACRLLQVVPDALEQRGVKRVLMLGDQMYGDYPPSCSLFSPEYFGLVAPEGRASVLDCTRDEVRALYQARHRKFWKHPAFLELQARFPCHMILDDHEIVDNFGTADEHSTPRYENLRAGALDAVYDYQVARALPRCAGERPKAFYQTIEYGSIAAFLMDLRSERYSHGEHIEVCSERQWQELERFLASQRDKHVLLLALSVPLLHVPDWLATIGTAVGEADGDVADRWTNPKMASSRDRLFHLIREHQAANPQQRLVLLGGDVHVGAVSRFAWSDETRDTYQLIASALSNREGFLLRGLAELVPKIGAVIGHEGNASFSGELLGAAAEHCCDGDPCNPYGKLNVGIVEIERVSPTESTVRLLLLGCREDGPPSVEVVFDSGRL